MNEIPKKADYRPHYKTHRKSFKEIRSKNAQTKFEKRENTRFKLYIGQKYTKTLAISAIIIYMATNNYT